MGTMVLCVENLQVIRDCPDTQAEADAIPRKTAVGGFYKSKIYVYSLESVVRAVKKKHGSLYQMVKNNGPQ